MDRPSSRLWLWLRLVWAPLSVLVVHRYAGAAWGHEPYIDPVIHTCGGLAMAHMLSILIARAQERLGRLTTLGRELMVFGLTAFVTLAWEVGEYFLSAYYNAHLPIDRRDHSRYGSRCRGRDRLSDCGSFYS